MCANAGIRLSVAKTRLMKYTILNRIDDPIPAGSAFAVRQIAKTFYELGDSRRFGELRWGVERPRSS